MRSSLELPAHLDGVPRLVFYPGSTIGNYTPDKAVEFLRYVRNIIGGDGGLLIGVDLQKDSHTLNSAYNDSAGVTAAFNLNSLSHVNTLTGANFDQDRFRHIAFYNEDRCRIEMHLESTADQHIQLAGDQISIHAGERILTEYSYKYTLDSFAHLAEQAGLAPKANWTDDNHLFSLQYYTAG